MKVMSIRIKSEKEIAAEVSTAWKAAEARAPYKVSSGTYFTSLEAVRRFLTPKRLAMLRLIKEKHPKSIYELARISERNFASVFRDVNTLKKHGLIKMNHSSKSPRRAVQLSVEYDELDFKIAL